MSVTLASIVGAAAARVDEHPLLLPTLRTVLPRLEARARRLARGDRALQDDLLAVGAVAVAEALRAYDPSRRVPLQALVTIRAYQRMSNAARPARSSQSRGTLRLVDGGECGTDTVGERTIVDDQVDPLLAILRAEQEVAIEQAVRRLPHRLVSVAEALLSGRTQAEIARDLGVSPMAVSKQVAKVRQLLAADFRLAVYTVAA